MKNQEAFTYCWTDHRDNMLYVGYHKGSQDDGYVCSSKWMLEEYKKRPEDFTRMILAEGTADDCHMLEVTILKAADAMRSDRFYNQTNGSQKHYNKHHTMKTRNKISKKFKGKPLSEDHRNKLSESHKGKALPSSTREKMSKSKKGKSPPNKGKKHKETTIIKMREWHKNNVVRRSWTKEQREQMSGIHNPMFGKSPANKGRKGDYIYITNGALNKMINPLSEIPMGWRKGMTKRKVIRA